MGTGDFEMTESCKIVFLGAFPIHLLPYNVSFSHNIHFITDRQMDRQWWQ